jgi:hypothetical protein
MYGMFPTVAPQYMPGAYGYPGAPDDGVHVQIVMNGDQQPGAVPPGTVPAAVPVAGAPPMYQQPMVYQPPMYR